MFRWCELSYRAYNRVRKAQKSALLKYFNSYSNTSTFFAAHDDKKLGVEEENTCYTPHLEFNYSEHYGKIE